jgi:ribosome-binding protein aMBF1 (putative translation factor)
MKEINSWEEVPSFRSEAEEADFWDTHSLGPALLDEFDPVEFKQVPGRRPHLRKVQLGADVGRRLEREAKRRGVSVEELAEQILSEGLRRQ